MAWILGLIFAIPGIPSAVADDSPVDLAKWVANEPPAVDSDQWLRANHSEREWIVFLKDGRPSARLRAANRPAKHPERQESYPPMPFAVKQGRSSEGTAGEWFSTRVDDGWIIGFNAGEWGGALWWYSPDGATRYRISDDQVVGFVPTASGLLALEGLSHDGSSDGKLVRLDKGADGRWKAETFVDLKHAPEVAVKDADGSLVVATHKRLLRVHPGTKKVDVLLDDAFWGGLYPKSLIVAPGGDIYIGMRHGVAKVEKRGDTYKALWLLPSR